MITPTIETKRLLLRPLSTDDAPAAFERWTSDPEVSRYMPYSCHKTVEDSFDWLNSIDNLSDTQYDFGICVRNEGNYLCGSCGVYYDEKERCFSVGYNLAKDHWRMGYGTEVISALIDFTVRTLKQTEIYAQYNVENVVSGHVLRKCGFEDAGKGTALKYDGVTTYEVIKLRYKVRGKKTLFDLNDGNKIEPVGFGTYQAEPGSIEAAVVNGYRYFDTASFYKNEEMVGAELKYSAVDRNEFFIASKAWPTEMGFENIKNALGRSLNKLKTDQLDLYLIHWPKLSPLDLEWKRKISDSWRAMESLKRDGYVKSIGVSNFLPHHLEPLLRDCEIVPAVDQLELHAGYMQQYAMTFCEMNKIHLQAWSPLGRGRLNDNDFIKDMADKYQVKPQKLMLRFLNQLDISVIPKSNSTANMISNLDIFDFTINREDMSILMSLPQFGFSGEFPDTADFS